MCNVAEDNPVDYASDSTSPATPEPSKEAASTDAVAKPVGGDTGTTAAPERTATGVVHTSSSPLTSPATGRVEEKPYGTGKPWRKKIRATITHDKDE